MVEYPDDWKVVPLSDVGEVCMCKRVLKSETSPTGDIPFYKIGTFGKTPDAYIRRDLYEAFRRVYSYPKAGDVLISAAGTIGRTVVFDGADSYFQDSNIVWLSNNEKLVGNDYLYWCYQVVNWQTEDGGIVARLYNGNFRATKIAVPPLPEQKRIAAVLGNVDKLIDNLSRQIEKKRLVKQGVMQDLLTGKKRLLGFKGEWVDGTLRGNVNCLRGVSYSGSHDVFAEESDRTIRLLRSNNIQEARFVDSDVQFINRLCASEEQVLREDDIMVCMANGSKELVGKSCYFDKRLNAPYTFGAFMACLRAKTSEVCMSYVFQLLNSQSYWGNIALALSGSSINNLRPGDILDMSFSWPTLAEQKAIAKVLGDIDAEIAKLEAKHEKYRQLKQGLMNDLLTGKVRI